jgi:hypothetical protein
VQWAVGEESIAARDSRRVETSLGAVKLGCQSIRQMLHYLERRARVMHQVHAKTRETVQGRTIAGMR